MYDYTQETRIDGRFSLSYLAISLTDIVKYRLENVLPWKWLQHGTMLHKVRKLSVTYN